MVLYLVGSDQFLKIISYNFKISQITQDCISLNFPILKPVMNVVYYFLLIRVQNIDIIVKIQKFWCYFIIQVIIITNTLKIFTNKAKLFFSFCYSASILSNFTLISFFLLFVKLEYSIPNQFSCDYPNFLPDCQLSNDYTGLFLLFLHF